MTQKTTGRYQVLGPLSEEEYAALKEDIAENGVQVAVVMDEDGNIIDGHHRVWAYEELEAEGLVTGRYPVDVRRGLTEEQKRDLAWTLNLQRRHLNQAQKRDAIANKLKESPEWADNRIAQLLGVDHKTVRGVRTSLEIRKELPKVELLEGKDGKHYPRSRSGDPSHLNSSPRHHDAVPKQMIEVEGKAYTSQDIRRLETELQKSERSQREAEKKANTRASNYKAELRQEVEAEKAEYQKTIDTLYSAEMAELKAKYGDLEEPRFADVPPEEWERQLREAKSARVIEVAKRIRELYGWPEWMGRYFPDEAAEAIADMVAGRDDMLNGWNYIIGWMEKVRDELEERGLRDPYEKWK
jgi:ParB-like chromosome segregation protein Spo0J